MMGRTHAGFSALGYVLYGCVSFDYATPITYFAGTVLAAGSGALPDIDERNSTVSRLVTVPIQNGARRLSRGRVGWITNNWVTRVLGRILVRWLHLLTGRHREGTHSLIAICISIVVAITSFYVSFVSAVIMALAFILAARLMLKDGAESRYIVTAILAGSALAWLSSIGMVDLQQVLPAIPVGVTFHIIGDLLSKDGVALFWPFWSKKYALKTFTVGSVAEYWVVSPLISVILAGLFLVWAIIPSIHWLLEGGIQLLVEGIPTISELGSK